MSYFNSFGITVTSANPLIVYDKNLVYSGNIVVPASLPNVMMLGGPNGTKSFTLDLGTPASSVSFYRAGIENTLASLPEWSATAFNSLGTPLATVGEPSIATSDPLPPQFTLEGAGITRITFTSTTGDAAFSSVLLDDFRISSVPEPETLALATGVSLGAIGFVLRRAKSRSRPPTP